jgi:Flp pilus assembly protein TadB
MGVPGATVACIAWYGMLCLVWLLIAMGLCLPSMPTRPLTHPPTRLQARLERMVSFLPGKLTGGLAWLAGVPDAADAAARLRKEPMFCMETGAEGGAASTLCVCVGVGEMLLAC